MGMPVPNEPKSSTIPVVLIAFALLICGLLAVLPRALPTLIWLFGLGGG